MEHQDGNKRPRLTPTQIVTALETTLHTIPRVADVEVCKMMCVGNNDGDDDISTVANYVWDHWLGEPDWPQVEELERQIATALDGGQA